MSALPFDPWFTDPRDLALFEALQEGLPLVSRPYAAMGECVGYTEVEVIGRLREWRASGLIKRLGVIVRHRRLGYRANAMVVWDVPDAEVSQVAGRICQYSFVTLCYRRPRRGSEWPYNLFCMIHGQDRDRVESQIRQLIEGCEMTAWPTATLFSTRCFKQRGARYSPRTRGSCAEIDRTRMNDTERAIINGLQGGFPVCERPFLAAAEELGLSEEDLIEGLRCLLDNGTLSRFGPMYHAERLGGALSLVAMEIPAEDFDRVAEQVNAYPEVAHNYARDHALNMWFVLATEKPERKDWILGEIERETGYRAYDMPKLAEYFVGLRLEV